MNNKVKSILAEAGAAGVILAAYTLMTWLALHF